MKEFQSAIAGARRAATMLATEPAVPDGHIDSLPAGPLVPCKATDRSTVWVTQQGAYKRAKEA